MKKLVLKLDIFDDKSKQKAMKTVSTLTGIDSISMDMKEKKMTVIGTVDPVHVVSKLRKYWPTSDLITVGPAQEPEKKEEKKDDGKKEEEKKPEEAAKKEDQEAGGKKEEAAAKKEEGEKGGGGGKEEAKKDNEDKKSATPPPPDPVLELVRAYRAYNPQMTSHYYVQSMEENPNSCAIC